jgi:hypothetical protein
MDREAAVIRTEMSQTRAELDQKLSLLETRAREFDLRENIRAYVRRHTPEFLWDRALGALLTMVGARLVLKQIRERRQRHVRMQAALRAYEGWHASGYIPVELVPSKVAGPAEPWVSRTPTGTRGGIV